MSLLGDAQQFIMDRMYARSPQLPVRGGSPRPQPGYITGGYGSPEGVKAQSVSALYEAAKERGGTKPESVSARETALPALESLVSKAIPKSSDTQVVKQYLALTKAGATAGRTLADISSAIAPALSAGEGVTSTLGTASKGLRLAGKAVGYAGAGLSAYSIARGEGKTGDYVNIGATLAQEALPIVAKAGLGPLSSAASSLSSGLSSVSGPLAIIGAANVARGVWGKPGVDWRSDKKTPISKVFDDPLIGLTANVGNVFGRGSAIAKATDTVGTQFAHYAGNPIGHAFNLRFDRAIDELTQAPSLSAQEVFGIRKSAADKINMAVNPAGAWAYSRQGNQAPLAAFALSPDPFTGHLAALGSSLIGEKASKDVAKVGAAILTGGLSNLFCFVAGTKIDMADGTKKNIESMRLLDECKEGGHVTGMGVQITNDVYDYRGIGVTGSHAVLEDGRWIRVRDGKYAKKLDIDVIETYIVNNVHHRLIINGITFADYGEVTDSGHMTEDQRLEYLNANHKVQGE